MMYHPTLEKLAELRLTGMREALLDQQAMADIEELGFDERLGLLLDREATVRADRRLKARLRTARFRQAATVEDLDFHTPRGLDRTLMNELIAGRWIKKHLNLLVTGPTSLGSQCTPRYVLIFPGFSGENQLLPHLSELLWRRRLPMRQQRSPKEPPCRLDVRVSLRAGSGAVLSSC